MRARGSDRPRGTASFGFRLAIVWMAVVVAAAALAPWLPLAGVDDTDVAAREQGPSLAHWFGTDSVGRDVFARTVWGARVSLVVGIAAILIGFLLGGALGLVAGFVRGWTDKVVSAQFDVLLAFPAIIFAVLVTSLTERSLLWVTLVLGALTVAPLGRLARASTLSVADENFVTAAQMTGATSGRILRRELLPNVVAPLAAFAMVGCGIAIVAEGSLAFLGLSVENTVSWGTIIVDGSSGRTLRSAPHVALCPIAVLFLTILALNWIGAVLQRRADRRASNL